MAIFCPQCGEIHFETSSAPPPTHCRKCEADLNGVASLIPLSTATAVEQPRSKSGTTGMLIGLGILVFAGLLWWFGVDRFKRAKKVEATVVRVETMSQADSGSSAGKIRQPHTASYTANGKQYYQYPGVRQLGDKFSVYYLPGDPGNAQEEPPYAFLIAAGIATKLGLILLIRGVFLFSVTRARESDYQRVMSRAGG